MKVARRLAALSLVISSIAAVPALGDNPAASFSTLVSTPLPIEGLTADERGNLMRRSCAGAGPRGIR